MLTAGNEGLKHRDKVNEEELQSLGKIVAVKLLNWNEKEQAKVEGMLHEVDILAWSPSWPKACQGFSTVWIWVEGWSLIYHRRGRLPTKHIQVVEEEVRQMPGAGVIVPATEALSFSAVITSTKHGEQIFCFECWPLNQNTRADNWQISKIKKVFHSLYGCLVFMTLDLFSV